jgi:hypothetical protein
MELYIYIDDVAHRVEMFQDEKVSVTSTIQNYSDIGKLFTDYSQSFTIPASPTNNSIFSHWYENAIDNGYDARIRYNAFIEIDTIPFRDGNVQLEKANKKNGYIESYTLTFYGNLTQLKDKFADDKLQVVFETTLGQALNHTYDASNIQTRITSGSTFDVRYPLIANDRTFRYNDASPDDVTTNGGSIVWTDLFPAVKINKILELIEDKYDIDFTGSFLTYNQVIKLWMLLKNAELPRAYSQGLNVNYLTTTGFPFSELNLATDIITTNWDGPSWGGVNPNPQRLKLVYQITPNLATINTIYKVELFVDGQVFSTFDDLSGVKTLTLYSQTRSEDPDNHEMYIRVSSLGDLTFTSRLEYQRIRSGGAISVGLNNTGQSMSFIQNIAAYVPDIKVSDFFMGLVKMFNLIITPTDSRTFKLEPLELYYQQGQIKDLTEYIYSDEADIEKPKLFKSIEFTYEKSENILNNAFNDLFSRQYGDLIYNSATTADSGKYEIKLPFEDVIWERATGSNFMTATLLNKDLQPYTPKPILMYENGIETVSPTIKLDVSTGFNSLSTYMRFSNEVNLAATDLSYLYSLNFGVEVSPWYLANAPQGLYKRFYEQYIANLYNQKTRVVKVKAKLEPLELTSLKLNNRIIIRDNRYIINSFTTDLTNGEASFDLINDYRALGYNSVGYRFANIEMANVDNTAQEFQVDVYMGLFANAVVATETGWASWSGSGLQTSDFSVNVSIAANATGLERTKNFEIKFEDFDGNIVFAQIPLTQDL